MQACGCGPVLPDNSVCMGVEAGLALKYLTQKLNLHVTCWHFEPLLCVTNSELVSWKMHSCPHSHEILSSTAKTIAYLETFFQVA